MDRRRAAVILAGSLVGASWSALEGSDASPRVVRLCGSHPELPAGAQDIRGNPAMAAFGLSRLEAGAGVTRPFGLEGLVEQTAWASWNPSPAGSSTTAFRSGWRGFSAGDLYRDDAVFGSCAWRWKDIAVGATASGLRSDYGEGVIGSAFGVIAGVGGRWGDVLLGASLQDPSILHAQPDWMGEPIEAALGIGLAPLADPWRTGIAVNYREGGALGWKLAQEVVLPNGVDLGVGLGLEPFRLAAGLGYRWSWSRFDAAVEGDPFLGWQTHVSLGFDLR